MKKIRVGLYVKGIWSPFVHGKVESMNHSFVYLDNGTVFPKTPKTSVSVISKKEAKSLPDFRESLRNSKHGLNIP